VPGLHVSEQGETIVVRARSGTITMLIPTEWEGRPVKVYTMPCENPGPLLRFFAYALVTLLGGVVLVGLISLVVLAMVRWL
jgi:hypothetical protein